MVEIQSLIATIYILYYSLIGVTIITFTLIIALVIIMSKKKLTNKKTHLYNFDDLDVFFTFNSANHICGFSFPIIII